MTSLNFFDSMVFTVERQLAVSNLNNPIEKEAIIKQFLFDRDFQNSVLKICGLRPLPCEATAVVLGSFQSKHLPT